MPVCEDLATKAEVQELRDQLNAVLGEKEDGAQETLFAKGASNPVVQAAGAFTLLGMAKTVAPKAVTDIILEGAATGVTWQKMASMNTGIKAKFGNGTTGSLAGVNAVANTAGGGAGVASTGAKVAGTSAGAVMVLGTLVQVAGTLALNKATVDILDARIEAESSGARQALDQQNSTMLRLYDKHEGDLDAVNQDIQEQNAIIANTQQQLTITQSDITNLSSQTATINSKLTSANQRIQELQLQNAEAVNQINELQTELVEAKAELIIAVTQVETQLNQALEIITKMQLEAQKTAERVTMLETKVTALESRMSQYEIDNANLQANVTDLREDVDALIEENFLEDQVTEIKSKLASAKLIIEQYRVEEKRKAGNGSAAGIGAGAGAQSGVLALANKLANPELNTPPIPTTITRDDVVNNPETFTQRLEQLLDRVTPDTMTPEQLEDFRGDIKTDFKSELGLAIATLLIPNLVDLKQQTSPDNISAATQAGLCKSLNGSGCPSTPGNPNPTQGLKGMQDDLALKIAQAADLAQGAAILSVVKNTNQAVRHGTYGLENIQKFASTAWKATHADKILNGITTALVIHNAAMLSKNLTVTVGETASIALQAMGVQDTNGEFFDVNTIIKAKMTSMISSVIGAENYAVLTQKIAAANRIYQSSANMLNIVTNLFDSARNVAELTANNTGKIGNALREAGAVYEDAYELMEEKVNPQNQAQRRLEGLTNTLGNLAEGASAIAEISSEVIETKDNIIELKAERKQLADETELFLDTKKTEEDAVKLESQAETEVEKIDFTKDETDSTN